MADTICVYTSILSDRTLSFCEKLVLNTFMVGNKKRCYWGMEQLSELLGTTRQTISKAIKTLEDKGYVIREKPRGKKYYLTYISNNALKKYAKEYKEPKLQPGELQVLFKKVIYGG